jgi:hypothetical protein
MFIASPTGSIVKGFFFNAEDAQSFASRMTKIGNEGEHAVVSTEAPTELVNSSPRIRQQERVRVSIYLMRTCQLLVLLNRHLLPNENA